MTPLQHANASLALKPAETNTRTDLSAVIRACQQTGLTGAPLDSRADHYFAGERFLDLITFLGCSPHVALQPEAGKGTFTHIVIHQHGHPVLFYGPHTRPPRCPHCGKANSGWREHTASQTIPCPHCRQTAGAECYNWRKTAGVARTLIEITDIYPGEALPQPALLTSLQQHTGVEWDYFYF